jgi:hypothetical protein
MVDCPGRPLAQAMVSALDEPDEVGDVVDTDNHAGAKLRYLREPI